MASDPEIRAHLQWLGYLQPVGLVVSAPALAAAGAFVNKNIVREQQVLIGLAKPTINDFPRFCREFLGWEATDLAGGPGGPELPRTLDVALPEYEEVLSPTYAVPDNDQKDRWLMLIQVLPRTVDLDEVAEAHRDDRHWHASPQARFDRLLRENDVPIGLLANGTHLRLVYAPPNESTGHLTFPVAAMCDVAGRPIVAALKMLLEADRLFTIPPKQRLPAILKDSRRYQNQVSTRLADQIQAALWELLRGFQAANEASKGELLKDVLREAPQEVYGGLLGTLMRLVFTLYAEDRGLLSDDPVYQGHYSVHALFERLRDESARYPDTMDQRFGAWAQLLTLFRLIHDGAAHGSLKLPARHGRLFNPDTWDFLEGRPYGDVLDRSRKIPAPRVPDGVVFRVLDNLMVLDGERISYRALDVEQIGSVYEAMMGFELRRAEGPSIGVRPHHVVVDIDELLKAKPADRLKTLRDEAKCDLAAKAAQAITAAKTPEELVAALGKKVSPRTPTPIAPGGLFLQPTEERRRSGSHYTPRSLTEPIVRTTLEPILKALGDKPNPEQILDLKVCDPAMGSGAFLVEACRCLGNALVESWDRHGSAPKLPPDEDLHTHARRLIASRCLYGVDKNPFAVDLAKLSLWLATLAKDHPFTFLDHSLRHGDSLVGLSREQIASFHWSPEKQVPLLRTFIDEAIKEAQAKRAAIHALGDEGDTESKARLHDEAVAALEDVRRAGDLATAAFFAREKPKDRETLRIAYAGKLQAVLDRQANPKDLDDLIDTLRKGDKPVPPFHWEIESPEVFSRDNPGFDAFVGNPPFLGGRRISEIHGERYRDWLATLHEEASSSADLIAHFYRRAFNLLRQKGTFGLIATNTIAQGDTRASGLRWICTHGGTIYAARRRLRWPAPGAAVVVSVVNVAKAFAPAMCLLDGKHVGRVTAFLFHEGGHDDPVRLAENADKSFQGAIVLGMGFTFDDGNPNATPIREMERLIERDPRNRERIVPYIGGEEVNDSPSFTHRRYVINFGEMSEDEARRWPDLWSIVEAKVKPDRVPINPQERIAKAKKYPRMVHEWWKFWNPRVNLGEATRNLQRVLVTARVSQTFGFAFLPNDSVFSEQLVVFAFDAWSAFAVLQSRVHEVWARFFSSSMKDDLRYTPSDCFDTFPFPDNWLTSEALSAIGRDYYEHRERIMGQRRIGLTAVYRAFHDAGCVDGDVQRLRDIHSAIDRVVLDSYGWTDVEAECRFLDDFAATEEDGSESRVRLRLPDPIQDLLIGRLLALNALRTASSRGSSDAEAQLQ